jgi:hypothetical protein
MVDVWELPQLTCNTLLRTRRTCSGAVVDNHQSRPVCALAGGLTAVVLLPLCVPVTGPGEGD